MCRLAAIGCVKIFTLYHNWACLVIHKCLANHPLGQGILELHEDRIKLKRTILKEHDCLAGAASNAMHRNEKKGKRT